MLGCRGLMLGRRVVLGSRGEMGLSKMLGLRGRRRKKARTVREVQRSERCSRGSKGRVCWKEEEVSRLGAWVTGFRCRLRILRPIFAWIWIVLSPLVLDLVIMKIVIIIYPSHFL